MKAAIGIDIGGTNTVFGIVDEAGKVLGKSAIPTSKIDDPRPFLKELAQKLKDLLSTIDDVECIGIGIGAPNGNYYSGKVEEAPNLGWKGVVPVVELMKSEFPEITNISLTNDANAAALGEYIYGGAKGIKNFVMVTLGTGLGSGFVVNGELVYGHDGFAGELGHITLVPDGRICGCGGAGHLETYCSATGMVRTAFVEALEAKGIEVPNLCRGGVCGQCMTEVVEGDVEHRDAFLDEKERQSCIMPCVSRAKSKSLTLDL